MRRFWKTFRDNAPKYNRILDQPALHLAFYNDDAVQERALLLTGGLLQSHCSNWHPGHFALHFGGTGKKNEIADALSHIEPSNWTIDNICRW